MILDSVWVIYRSDSQLAKKEAIVCSEKLKKLGINVSLSILGKNIHSLVELAEKIKYPDIAVVLGGDGTVLRAARFFSSKNIPILNFNVGGNLGFLTHDPVMLNDEKIWEQIINDQIKLEIRMMLNVKIKNKLKQIKSFWALNDFYFRSYRDEISPTCILELEINGEKVDEYRGDGLIISTPTGSTAYSLATGGPIIHPEIDAFVVSPICPMSLSSRPIVIPGGSQLTIKSLGDVSSRVKLWQDGVSGALLDSSDNCVIQKADHKASMIILNGNPTYYRTLSQKLNWGGSHIKTKNSRTLAK